MKLLDCTFTTGVPKIEQTQWEEDGDREEKRYGKKLEK